MTIPELASLETLLQRIEIRPRINYASEDELAYIMLRSTNKLAQTRAYILKLTGQDTIQSLYFVQSESKLIMESSILQSPSDKYFQSFIEEEVLCGVLEHLGSEGYIDYINCFK